MNATLETPTVADKPLAEFAARETVIAKLRERFAPLTSCTDAKEYAGVRKALTEIVALRTGIEKRRKELKQDALDWGRKVDSEANRLESLVREIEDPLKTM